MSITTKKLIAVSETYVDRNTKVEKVRWTEAGVAFLEDGELKSIKLLALPLNFSGRLEAVEWDRKTEESA